MERIVSTDINFTYDILTDCVEKLNEKYPFIRIFEIGKSVLGKSIYALAIGEGKNEVMYNGSHHANEWITTNLLMRFIEQYSDAYANGDSVANRIFEETTLYIVPMVNVDGVDLLAKGTVSDDWKANARGVDLNLNYPATWEVARDIKFAQGYTMPGSRDFVGEYPLSEPETRTMARFTREHNFSLTLSFHTQGEVIYWKYLDFAPPNAEKIAGIFSKLSRYDLENTPYESGHAGYKDWFIKEYNRPSYTIECGLGENPLPIERFGKIYRDNVGILISAALVDTSI